MTERVQPAQSSAAIQRMLSISEFRQYRPKKVILQQGSVSESVYYVLKGSVTVEVYDESGQRLVFYHFRR